MAKEVLLSATFNEIYQDPSPQVFVLNTSKGDKVGMVQMTITPGNEQAMSVNVPNTWAPFDITTQIAKKFLMESTNFRRAINMGMLKLLDTASALHYLETNSEAALENSRAMQNINGLIGFEEHSREMEAKAKEDEAPRKNALDIAKQKLLMQTNQHMDFVQEANAEENAVTIKLIEAVNRDDITEQELYTIVRNLAHENNGKLNSVDKLYIIENVKHLKVLSFVNNLGI